MDCSLGTKTKNSEFNSQKCSATNNLPQKCFGLTKLGFEVCDPAEPKYKQDKLLGCCPESRRIGTWSQKMENEKFD